jgi:hypothetical protein
MQFSASAALGETDLQAFRSLHLSLNAPVIAIDELPVGPARAGVVLCVQAGGDLHVQIALRSLRTGEVVEIASRLDADAVGNQGAAVEAALSYAEGMGFLFDEDEIATAGDDAREKAESLWRDLVEGSPVRALESEGSADIEPVLANGDDSAAPAISSDDQVEGPEALDIPVEVLPARPQEIAVEFGSIPDEVAPAVAAGVLSKFRLTFDRVGSHGESTHDEMPEFAVGIPQESRIRVLSRY